MYDINKPLYFKSFVNNNVYVAYCYMNDDDYTKLKEITNYLEIIFFKESTTIFENQIQTKLNLNKLLEKCWFSFYPCLPIPDFVSLIVNDKYFKIGIQHECDKRPLTEIFHELYFDKDKYKYYIDMGHIIDFQ